MSLRPAILGLLQSSGHTLTRELAAHIGATSAAVFRELAALESEGAVARRVGPASIGNVGWRLTPSTGSLE